MAAADYRLMSEATGQRIAAALEALSGFGAYLTTADVVNSLTSGGTTVPLSAEMGKTLSEQIGNFAYKATKRTNIMATITFENYTTSALIFAAVSNSNGILYVYSNGYLCPIKTDSYFTVTLSSDYKTITVTVSGGYAHVGCLSTNLKPTIT